MKENFNKIMQNGGFAVIVGVIAMSLYLCVMSTAQKCSADSIVPVEIKLTDEGNLYLNYVYEDKDALMVLWETDGGTIKPLNKNEEFKEQYTDNNKWYYSYGKIADEFVWDSKDADENEYEIATVRAILYKPTEGKNQYFIAEAAAEVQMTVTYKDGKVVETSDRIFSNPVRKDSDKNWSQIYIINEGENDINTYRYRTGKDIPDEEYLFLRWEADGEILCETDVHNGLIPKCGVLNSNKNKEKLVQVNTVSVFKEKEQGKIEAFLVTDKYYEQENVEEKNKHNKAELEFK